MKKILLIQFRTDISVKEEKSSYERIAIEDGTFVVDTINALSDEYDWAHPEKIINEYDGIILGGSGEYNFTGNKNDMLEKNFSKMMQNTSKLLHYVVAHDFPTLGVCFGHQMIAQHLGVTIIKDKKQAKAGTHELCLLDTAKNDAIFKGIPKSFIAQYGHSGSLSKLPKKAILLATGPNCNYSAFRYNKNIYGVQFHPEMDRDDMIFKLALYKDYAKYNPHFVQNTKPTPFAPYIIRNFAKKGRTK